MACGSACARPDLNHGRYTAGRRLSDDKTTNFGPETMHSQPAPHQQLDSAPVTPTRETLHMPEPKRHLSLYLMKSGTSVEQTIRNLDQVDRHDLQSTDLNG